MIMSRKFWTVLIASVVLASPAFKCLANDFGFTAPASNSVLVMVQTGVEGVTNIWEAETAYSVGAAVKTNGNTYVCALPGTSGTDVSVMTGFQVTDGTVTWLKSRDKNRHGFALTLDGTSDIYVTYNVLAAQGQGVWLAAGEGPYQFSPTDDFQGRVSIYSTSTVTVTGMEW